MLIQLEGFKCSHVKLTIDHIMFSCSTAYPIEVALAANSLRATTGEANIQQLQQTEQEQQWCMTEHAIELCILHLLTIHVVVEAGTGTLG
jgi:hypothetical protein